MFIKIYPVLFCVLFSLNLKTQNFEFGKITANDFTDHLSLADSTVDALVLFDSISLRIITIEDYFFLKLIRHKRVLILKDEAIDQATVVFEKKGGDNLIKRDLKSSFEGYTYHLKDGKVIVAAKLDSTDIYKDKFTTKVVFPKIKKGCIFELKSEIEEPIFINLLSWDFQNQYPVVRSSIDLLISEHFDIATTSFGGEPIKPLSSLEAEIRNIKNSNYHLDQFLENKPFLAQRVYYSLTNLPAFSGEKYLHNPIEHKKSIHFTVNQLNLPSYKEEIMGYRFLNVKKFKQSWEEFSKEYLKKDYLLNSLKRIERLQTFYLPKFNSTMDDKSKIDSIIFYLKNKVQWNGKEDYEPQQSIFETLEKGSGNSADINILLYSLLNAASFEVYPVVISSRGLGSLKTQFADKNQLNKIIVAIKFGENLIFRDATNKYLNNALLPLSAYNGKAALLKEDGVEFIDLSSDYLKMNEKFQHKFIVKNNKTCFISAIITPTLFRSAELRKSLDEEKSMERVKKWLLSRSFVVPDSVVIDNETSVSDALKIRVFYTLTMKEDSSKLSLPPFIWGKTLINPFINKNDKQPAELDYCLNQYIVSEILFENKLPELKLPEKLTSNFNGQSIIYQLEAGIFDNSLNIMSRLKTNKTFFSSTESIGLGEYFRDIIKKQNEKIIIIN